MSWEYSGQSRSTLRMEFEQRLEVSEGIGDGKIWGESILGEGNSKCKGPEAGEYLECSGKSKEASMVGYGVGESAGGSKVIALTVRPLAFPLSNMKNL